ncbi:uncharacterized protein JCM10292_004315 [Rhodotorula paludigena]|uniref:uncharacterized protein n=1 Tax=Rhodotorula paludigena TaxID=86838 RepID=UPI00316CC993
MALRLPAHSLSDAPASPITGVHLNADGSLFATATLEGWVVYRTNPLQVITRRDLPDSSLRIVLPLECTNLVFLVGGPPSPLYPPNKVIIWDDKLRQAAAELEFREDVRGLAVRRDRLVVVLRRRVIVFVLGRGEAGVWREGGYETADNPKGLVALATEPGSTLLAFPGRQPGQVQLVRLPPLDPASPPLPPPPSHDPTASPYPSVSVILAHTTALSALSTTPNGAMLATASSKGTLVRIWDAQSSYLVKELRRGTDSAEIFAISFRADAGAVAVSSDKGTVHAWDLRREKEDKRAGGSESGTSTPRQKQLSMLKPYLPKYFSSEWSHSQFRLPPPGPAASRLPFSLSNPGPYPSTPFSPSPAPQTGAPSAPTTVEDDVCICAWVEVEAEDDDGDDANAAPIPSSSSRAGTPTHGGSRRGSTSSAADRTAKHHKPRQSSLSSATSATSVASGAAPRPLDREREKENRRHASSSSTSASSYPSAYNHPPASSSGRPAPAAVSRAKRTESQLVALTHSGGWFRIALDRPARESKGKERTSDSNSGGGISATGGSGNVTPRAAGAPGVIGLGRDAASDCRLVEYRRFGEKDGW